MRVFTAMVLGLILLPDSGVAQTDERPPPNVMADVVKSIEALDRMRSGLAASIARDDEPVDRATFGNVCRPVGRRAAELSAENPWTVQQMAVRYRNPGHEPDPRAREIHRLLEEEPDLQAIWTRSRREGIDGYRYFRRITVEPSCLACHGAEEDRPAFVAEEYPDDRAFGFEAGDLRGVYSVFVPLRASGDSTPGPDSR